MRNFYRFTFSFFISLNALGSDYVIYKGDEYSSPSPIRPFIGQRVDIQVEFDETAKYTFDQAHSHFQADINKVYGFADCETSHMQNSARIGWRWYHDKLEAFAFTHKGGSYTYESLGFMDINTPASFSIELSPDKRKYIYTYGEKVVQMDRGCTQGTAIGYLLFPYFGGTMTAPHDITIKLNTDTKFADFSTSAPYPNPTNQNSIHVDLSVGESLNIGFKIFNLLGQLAHVVAPKPYAPGSDYKGVVVYLGDHLANGIYLVVPYADENGTEVPGIVRTKGNALKVVLLR